MDRRGALILGMASALGGLPPRRPDQLTFPPSGGQEIPGARTPVLAQRVVVFGTGKYKGIFVYSGTPAHGNLIASIAATANTDPFGNAYLPGIVSYGSSPPGVFSQLLAGVVRVGVPGDTAPGQFALNSGGNNSLTSEVTSGADVAAQINLLSKIASGSGHPQLVFTPTPPGAPLTTGFAEFQGTISIVDGTPTITFGTPTGQDVALLRNAIAQLRISDNGTGNKPRLQIQGLVTGPDALLSLPAAAVSEVTLATYLNGDLINRLNVYADGSHRWGDGTDPLDTQLFRTAPAQLRIDDNGSGNKPRLAIVSTVASAANQLLALVTSVVETAMGVQVAGDTSYRYQIFADGSLRWGPGSSGLDTQLFREAASRLRIDDDGSGNKPRLAIVSATSAANQLLALVTSVVETALGIQVSGDANYRFQIDADGKLHWGAGATALDTIMARSAAGLLFSDAIAANVSGAAETFHAFAFTNSWAQSARAGSNYRLIAAPPNEMEVIGSVVVPAGAAAGQAITTAAPAAYRPASNQSLLGVDITTNLVVRLGWQTSGVLQFQGPLANTAVGNTIDIPSQRINLTD